MKNTIIVKKNTFDKFYTKPEIAALCTTELLKHTDCDMFIEPSAGGGVFVDALKQNGIQNIVGLDLQPTRHDIIAYDFLNYEPHLNNKITFIGNPPFGKNCNLAVKFFNHAASFGSTQTIGFIVPKTFKKTSIHHKLHKFFELISDIDLPRNSFLLEGSVEYDVPTCFQVWKRTEVKREIFTIKNQFIEFVKNSSEAEFAIRRVGGRAGQVLIGTDYNSNSTYFCREIVYNIKNIISKIDFSKYAMATAGVKSVSKHEIVAGIAEYLRNE